MDVLLHLFLDMAHVLFQLILLYLFLLAIFIAFSIASVLSTITSYFPFVFFIPSSICSTIFVALLFLDYLMLLLYNLLFSLIFHPLLVFFHYLYLHHIQIQILLFLWYNFCCLQYIL